LGCSDEEKFHPQMVSLNINVNFTNPPLAANTDSLQGTVCYLDIVRTVTLYCQNNRFNLIEYLAQSVYQKISESIASCIDQIQSITVTLHKISPPVPGVHGGVKWTHHVNYGGSL
jgi:dihydroneopterin aldolase